MNCLQPRSYGAFRCIGADCEDTCCAGWIINVDQPAYEAYQRCGDPELGPLLRELVVINAESAGTSSYAKMTLSGLNCPFLAEGLCSIQKKLGEEHLPRMCSQFPRIANVFGDVLHRSLDLACPEAARLTLLDPNAMRFDEEGGPVRELIIWLLQNRVYPLSKRLVILGSLCDQFQGAAARLELLEAYRDGVERDSFRTALETHHPQPAAQLELVLELIVRRAHSDFTAPRLRTCYQRFMQTLEWTAESNMDDVARRYAAAYSQYYAPFVNRRPHIIENYLVSYVHRGWQTSGSMTDQCLLLMAHYAIIQALLIGMAAFHQSEFGADHVIQVIQSFTKAFEHSASFSERALQVLAAKGVRSCASMAILLLNGDP
jgi:lysine-N-methylase